MRDPNLGSASYQPGDPSSIGDFPALVRYLRDLEQRLSTVLQRLADGHLDTVYAAPEKPRDGDFRVADGVKWNPGRGRGLYRYDGVLAAWRFYTDS